MLCLRNKYCALLKNDLLTKNLSLLQLSGVRGTVNFGYVNQFEFEVDDVRVENMLRTAEHPMALFANNKEARDIQKAIIISIIHLPCFNVNANIFKVIAIFSG